MSPTAPKAFLFDIGNVLARFDIGRAIRRLIADSDGPPADPAAAILAIKDALERGALSETVFVAEATRLLGYRGTPVDFLAAWTEIFSENAAMSRRIAALAKAGLPLYLLSNTNGPHLRHLRARYAVLGHFRGGVFSHEEGMMKPDEGIFRAAIERYALVPGETLYVDDLRPNIETGRALGFMTHLYDPDKHAAFEALLDGFGIAP